VVQGDDKALTSAGSIASGFQILFLEGHRQRDCKPRYLPPLAMTLPLPLPQNLAEDQLLLASFCCCPRGPSEQNLMILGISGYGGYETSVVS
jgi:hypothetical protein